MLRLARLHPSSRPAAEPCARGSRLSALSHCLVALPAGLLALCAAVPLPAADTIEVSHAQAAPGAIGVRVIVTAENTTAIHGYSVALSYPAEVLDLTDLSIEGTHIQELEPEFVAPTTDRDLGVAVLGVIFSFVEPVDETALAPSAAPGDQRIIARLTFDVRPDAPGGVYPLRLVDGLGNPPAYNRFTRAGTTLTPELVDGTFFVEGGNVLSLDRLQAIPGATPSLPIFAYAQHAEPLAGFSITFGYRCSALDLLEASTTQTSVAFELGSAGLIEFYQSDVDDGVAIDYCRSRTAVVFDYVEPFDCQVLSASPNGLFEQTLMRYRFKVKAEARADKEYTDLFLDKLDDPIALDNTFLIAKCPDPPVSVQPRLVHGKIYFSRGSLRGRVVEKLTGDPVRGASVTTDPEGYEVTTGPDGSFLFESAIPGPYTLRVRRSGYYAGTFHDIAITGAGSVDDAGDLAIYRIPRGPGILFRRGFINADSRADVSDAVWMLNWLFKGGQPPDCMQAADVNDDGRDDISDAVWLLNYMFTGGTPPPEPFTACGPDPDDSRLTCESIPACP